MKTKRFAGLDGLRFISISFVILHHLFTFKSNFGFTSFDLPILGVIGYYGIHFFFMGSGFLITYMLLTENEQKGTISLKNFFVRRLLRIWPAYYLLIIIALVFALHSAFFQIPAITGAYLNSNFHLGNTLFFLFLPHLASFFTPTAPLVHHTYTIGIEEQFYFIWGLIFYFIPKHAIKIFIVILIGMPILNVFHHYVYEYINKEDNVPDILPLISSGITYLKYSRFSTFAIGALFGYSFFYKKNWINFFKSVYVQLAVYSLFILSIYFNVQPPYIEMEYISFIMACIMLMATFKKESIVNFSVPWLEYLGKISYGIYLFHIFAIVLSMKIMGSLLKLSITTPLQLFFLCVITLSISILFGYLSYQYFERYFLNLKKRFYKS